jgi:ABC-2 type transport system ATP-binding protein
VFGFLGANGAGKTTAIRMLTGCSRPHRVEARVAGHDVEHEPEQVKRSIGYMSQRFSLYEDLTVEENVQLYAGIYGLTDREIRERMDELLGASTWSPRRRAGRLAPARVAQKLAFSVALVHEPAIVFLDEPTGASTRSRAGSSGR